MAIRDIVTYLNANREKFTQEELILQLRKAGYPENEIQAALSSAVPEPPQYLKMYTQNKWFDYIIGFVGGNILALLASSLVNVFGLNAVLFGFSFFNLLLDFVAGIGALLAVFIFAKKKHYSFIATGMMWAGIIRIGWWIVLMAFSVFGVGILF